MNNLAITYQHIGAILSFEFSNTTLEQTLSDPAFNWDAIVVIGSQHLVLPAIYCRLSSKNLLHVLPEELNTYLADLTAINRNRNARLLKQVKAISHLLNEHNIAHVFLKGAALLASDLYEDNAERMVGDIDILINDDQLHYAFKLLNTNGYSKTMGYAYQTIGFRHLDRLISDTELAAIELHSHLINKKYGSLLNPKSILDDRVVTNGIAIPSKNHLALHNVMSWQLNDYGHFYNALSLKSIYDFIVINMYRNDPFIKTVMQSKYGQSYLAIGKNYFTEITTIQSNNYMRYVQYSHKFTISYRPIRVTVKYLKYSLHFIRTRLYLLYSNKHYTRHILKKVFSK